jgi:hypothetical protein
MLNFGEKKIRALRDKINKYSNYRVVRKKISERKKKPYVCNSSNPQSFRGAWPPWAPYRGSALDPLGGPQTPRLLTPP